MPLSYEIDPQAGIVRLIGRGDLSVAESRDALQAVAADPAAPSRLDLLVDLRECTGLPSSDELRVFAGELRHFRPKLAFGLCAFVASRDSLFGVSRMFAVYAERAFDALYVARDLEEGLAWLAQARAEQRGSTCH